jgi:hypothetical protein
MKVPERGQAMRKWVQLLYRPFFVVMIGIGLVMGVRQVIHGELTKVEMVCYVVCLLALSTLVVNNRKNRILNESMMGLGWAAIAVAQWVQDRRFFPVIGWAVLAVWSFSFAYTAWKNPQRYAKIYGESADRLGKGND